MAAVLGFFFTKSNFYILTQRIGFKTWFVGSILGFNIGLIYMVWPLKLCFDFDFLAFLGDIFPNTG
jgi:hypothetical protein